VNRDFAELDRTTYAQSLRVQSCDYAEFEIEVLRLSHRPGKALWRQDITSLDQLLEISPDELLEIPNLGQGSIQEIEKKLRAFLRKTISTPWHQGESSEAPLPPKSLRDEWQLFAGDSAALTDLEELPLAPELLACLRDIGIVTTDDLLAQCWPDFAALMGDDEAGQILDALVAAASEARSQRARPATSEMLTGEALVRLQEGRWSQTPLRDLGLSKATVDYVLRAQFAGLMPTSLDNLGDLLAALDVPTSGLFWSLSAYCEIWELAVGLDLRRGHAMEHRLRRIETEGGSPSFEEAFALTRELCSEREWTVLQLRFGLGTQFPDFYNFRLGSGLQPQTLQEIAPNLRVSRERARQLEGRALKICARTRFGSPWLTV
jgi:hypothetical protein